MKLAEALVLRRDTQNKLDKLKENLIANTVIQEDDTLDVSTCPKSVRKLAAKTVLIVWAKIKLIAIAFT